MHSINFTIQSFCYSLTGEVLLIFLGRDVPLDQTMLSCIMRPYFRQDAKNFYPIPDLLVSRNFISVVSPQVPGKLYPIRPKPSDFYHPYSRLNCSKTLPFTATHTYIPYIWEYTYPRTVFSVKKPHVSYSFREWG